MTEEFCETHFNNYNKDQFEAEAIRFYYGKKIFVMPYALDKSKQRWMNFNYNKLYVKKIKLSMMSFGDVLSYIDEFNFTLTNENYPLEDIEVINK